MADIVLQDQSGNTLAPIETRRPWDRLETETPTQYEAFTQYISMKPGERSLEAVAHLRYQGKQPNCKGLDYHRRKGAGKRGVKTRFLWGRGIGEWSAKNRWVERARAWDEYQYEERRKVEIERLRADVMESWDRRREARHRAWEVASGLLDEVRKQLAAGLAPDPKSLRELVLAAEKAGIVEDRAWLALAGLPEEKATSIDLPPDQATAVASALAALAESQRGGTIATRTDTVIQVDPA